MCAAAYSSPVRTSSIVDVLRDRAGRAAPPPRRARRRGRPRRRPRAWRPRGRAPGLPATGSGGQRLAPRSSSRPSSSSPWCRSSPPTTGLGSPIFRTRLGAEVRAGAAAAVHDDGRVRRFTSSPRRSTSSPPGMLHAPGRQPRRYSSGVRVSTMTMSSPAAMRRSARGDVTSGVCRSCSTRSPKTLLGMLRPCTVGRPCRRPGVEAAGRAPRTHSCSPSRRGWPRPASDRPSSSQSTTGVAGAVTSIGSRGSSRRRGSGVARKMWPRSYAPRSRTSRTACASRCWSRVVSWSGEIAPGVMPRTLAGDEPRCQGSVAARASSSGESQISAMR